MRLATPLLLPVFTAVCTAFPKLGDVFEVDTRDPSVHFSSCLRRVKADDPASTLFDPEATADDESHLLNKFWKHTHVLNKNVLEATSPSKFNTDKEVVKLMNSFFTIMPMEPDRPKYEEVRRRYRGVQDLIEKTQANDKDKPKLFCDSTYYEWHKGSEPARDKNGNERKDKNGRTISLTEWETSHGRSPDRFWYFWVSFGDERGYMVSEKRLEKSASQDPNIPYPIDPRTKRPSFCETSGADGWTWTEDQLPAGSQNWPGTDSWLRTRHVSICPKSLREFSLRHHEMNLSPQPIGTRLDNMGITALTLYHELFHLRHTDMPDATTNFPKRQPDGTPDPKWPDYKTAYVAGDINAWGGIQCMTLPMYTLAYPHTVDLSKLVELRNPESYAWFSWTIYMTHFADGGGQTWSNGAARPKGSKAERLAVSIPAEPKKADAVQP